MKIALGWMFVATSFAPWAVYSALPFLALPRYAAALLATGAFAAGQVLFIVGLALLGGNALVRIRSRLRCRHRCKPQ
jgi:hypothetical protein